MKIATTYDAFWFLNEHPKFRCRERMLLLPERAKDEKAINGQKIRTMKDEYDGQIYSVLEFPLWRHALYENLDIFYTKVDDTERVNDDRKKNKFIECWLEFGPIKWCLSAGNLRIQGSHDIDLHCGAQTFDEALVKLARLARKHYGDIHAPKWMNNAVEQPEQPASAPERCLHCHCVDQKRRRSQIVWQL